MTDQFITLFDQGFLHHGLALHRSLRRWLPDARLAVIAMDETCVRILLRLQLPGVTVIPVETVLDEHLRVARGHRTRGEFCWTLSPVAVQTAMAMAGPGGRGIYLDADLWFRSTPKPLLDAMDAAGAAAQITGHGFSPRRAPRWEAMHGRFCVQWVAARSGGVSEPVIAWWRERCTEWCFNRVEVGRFGDQKYLDAWPRMLGSQLHIVDDHAFGAPWNMRWMVHRHGQAWQPTCFHFHGFRAIAGGWRWVRGYWIPRSISAWYDAYQAEIEASCALIRTIEPWQPPFWKPVGMVQKCKSVFGLLTKCEISKLHRKQDIPAHET